MRGLRHALAAAGLAFGVVAEWVARPELVALDAAAGVTLIAFGYLAWSRRQNSWVGLGLVLAGFAWFAGTVADWALYFHRGVLAHLILVYPAARLVPSRWLDRAAIAGAYAYAAAYPLAGDDLATIAFALALVALALRRFVDSGGRERRARAAAVGAAAVFGGALAVAGATRLLDLGGSMTTVLVLYDLAVAVVGTWLVADLLFGRWTRSTVTGLVVDLGEAGTGTLGERLARTLADPSLVVAYWVPEQGRYVDEAGRPVELPTGEDTRAVTWIEDGSNPLAALIHDGGVLEDPELVAGVAAATRLAVSNARLQADVRGRAAQVAASRRRLVEAADDQRRLLERELREGAERRLARVAELVVEVDPELGARLGAVQEELRDLARGIHPAALTEGGIAAAVRELAARSPVAVDVVAPPERFPAAVEAAAYFVCSEALANAAKYADASRVRIAIAHAERRLVVEVADDGVGGADPAAGSGLRGLADRLEALGGRLRVESPRGVGTRLVGKLPLDR